METTWLFKRKVHLYNHFFYEPVHLRWWRNYANNPNWKSLQCFVSTAPMHRHSRVDDITSLWATGTLLIGALYCRRKYSKNFDVQYFVVLLLNITHPIVQDAQHFCIVSEVLSLVFSQARLLGDLCIHFYKPPHIVPPVWKRMIIHPKYC